MRLSQYIKSYKCNFANLIILRFFANSFLKTMKKYWRGSGWFFKDYIASEFYEVNNLCFYICMIFSIRIIIWNMDNRGVYIPNYTVRYKPIYNNSRFTGHTSISWFRGLILIIRTTTGLIRRALKCSKYIYVSIDSIRVVDIFSF